MKKIKLSKNENEYFLNIKKLRKSKGLTQGQLSELTGFDQQTISAYENGKTRMTVESLILICKALDCSTNEVITGQTGVSVTGKHLIDVILGKLGNMSDIELINLNERL